MAKHLNVSLGFTADTSLAVALIRQLLLLLDKILSGPRGNTPGLGLTKEINDAIIAAGKLSATLKNSLNLDGSLNLDSFSLQLKASDMTITKYAEKLYSLGPSGQLAFAQLALSITTAEVPLKRANTWLTLMGTTLKNSVRWLLSSSLIHGFMGSILRAYGYALDLNSSLNNIRIVTGLSTTLMALFAAEANKAAKSLSASTLDYTDAALIYYQLGLNDQLVKERTDVTIKMANVSRQSAETVSDLMTAIWNNFAKGGENLEYYADVITALGAATASSSEEISTGLEKFAAIADTVGLSYENASAALATITATTRLSADTVGTGLRTLFARLQGLSLGETLEDGVDLTKYTKALQTVGVLALDSSGNLRAMDDVLEDLAGKWQGLSEALQTALAQTVGGVRQYTTLIALMDNWDFMERNQLVAANAEGTLQELADIYAESWEAAQKRVQAAMESIYSAILKDDFFIDITKGFGKFLDIINNTIKGLGGIKGVLLTIGTLITTFASGSIAKGLENLAYNLNPKGRLDLARSMREEATANLKLNLQSNDTFSGYMAADVYTSLATAQDALLNKTDELISKHTELSAIEQQEAQILLLGHLALGQQVIKVALLTELYLKQATTQTNNFMRQYKAAYKGASNKGSALSPKEMQDAITKAGELEKLWSAAASTVERLQQMYNNAGKDGVTSVDSVKEAVQTLVTNTNDLASVFGTKVSTALLNLANADIKTFGMQLSNVQRAVEALGTDAVKEFTQIKASAETLGMSGESIKILTDIIASCNSEGAATGETFLLMALHSKELQAILKEFLNFKGNTLSAANAVVQFGQGMMTMGMVISLTKGIVNAFNDETMSTGDRFTTLLTSVGFLIPSLKRLKESFSLTVNILGKPIPMGWIAVAGAALAAAIAGLSVAYKDWQAVLPEAVLERTKEVTANLKKESEQCKEKADALKDSLTKYDEAILVLDDCTYGTEEWKTALENVNLEILNIINNFPELGKIKDLITVDPKTGLYILNKEAATNAMEGYNTAANVSALGSIMSSITGASLTQSILNNSFYDKMTTSAGEAVYLQYQSGTNWLGDATYNTKNYGELIYDAIFSNLDSLTSTLTSDAFAEQVGKIVDDFVDTDSTINLEGYGASKILALKDYIISQEEAIRELGNATENINDITETSLRSVAATMLGDEPAEIARLATGDIVEDYNLRYLEVIDEIDDEISRTDTVNDNTKIASLWGEYTAAIGRTDYQLTSKDTVKGGAGARVFRYTTGDDSEVLTVTELLIATAIAAADALEQLGTAASEAANLLGGLSSKELGNGIARFISSQDGLGFTAGLIEGITDVNSLETELRNEGIAIEDIATAMGLDVETFLSKLYAAIADAKASFNDVSTDLTATPRGVYNLLSLKDSTIDTALNVASLLQSTFNTSGEGGVSALGLILSQVDESALPDLLTSLNDIQWDDNNAIYLLQEVCEDAGLNVYNLTDAIEAYSTAMLTAANKSLDFSTRLSTIRGNIADVNSITKDIEQGDIISDDDYNKLVGLNLNVSDLFFLTDSGWQFLGDIKQLNDYLSVTDSLLLMLKGDLLSYESEAASLPSSDEIKEALSSNTYDTNLLSLIANGDILGSFMNSSYANGFNADALRELIGIYNMSPLNPLFDLSKYEEAEAYIRDFYLRLAQYKADAESGNFDDLHINELIASTADGLTDLSKLREDYYTVTNAEGKTERLSDGGPIDSDTYDKYAETVYKQELAMAGYDEEVIEEMPKLIKKAAKETDQYTEGIEDNAEALYKVAQAAVQARKGYDKLVDLVDDYNKAMEDGEDTEEIIDDMAESMEDFLGISDEATETGIHLGQSFKDYIAKNMDVVLDALNGDIDALVLLLAAAALDYLIELGLDLASIDALMPAITDTLALIQSLLDAGELRVGDNINPGPLMDALNGIINSCAMTSDLAQQLLALMGFDAEVEETTVPKVAQYWQPATYDTSEVQDGDSMFVYPHLATPGKWVTGEGADTATSLRITSGKYVGGGGLSVPGGFGGGRGGGGRGGGGGGGGGSKPKDKKKLVDEQDRYHEIKEIVDDLSRQYDDLSNAKDRAFGTDKLKAMDAEKAKLQELANAELRYYNEALNYLAQDKRELASYGYNIKYDAAGRITNYNDVIALAVNRFNNSARGDSDEEAYSNFMDALSRYEESVNTAEEHAQLMKDYYEQIYDLELERIQYTVEMQNDVAEDYLDILDHMLTMIEDDAFAAAEAMGMLGKQAELTLQQISVYRDGIEQILKQHGGLSAAELQAVLNGTATDDILNRIDLTEDEIETIRDYQDALLEANETLKDLRDEVQEKLMDAFDAWNDKIEEGMDLFDHYGTILEEYDDIIGIVGKDMLGISDDLLQALDDALINNAIERLRGSKDIMDSLRDQEAHALQQLQYARETGSEQDIRLWEDTVREVQERTREAEEDMLDNWSDALDSAAEMFEDAVDRAVSAFEAGMSGGLGSLDALQDAFDQLKEIADRYVDDYKEIYELSKLNRDILNSIDDTDNVRAKKALRDLQKEINDLQEGDQEMSQYDLDYLRKKYELRLAELQLEEAQNAKSQVRMSRDSEGNWSYVYTADEDAVEKARLNVEDKLYEMLELNTEYIKEVLDGILQSQIDLTNALRDLDKVKFASDEEYYAEVARLTDYYNGLNQYYQDEMRKGLENNKTTYDEDWKNYSDLTGYKMSKDSEYLDSFDESIYSLLTGFDTLKEAQDAFATNTDLMVNDLRNAFRNWRSTIEEAMRAADTSIARFGDDVYWSIYGDGSDTVPGIIGASDKAAESVEAMAQRMEQEFKAAQNAVTSWQDMYSDIMQEAIDKNTEFVKSLEEIMRAQTNMLKGTTSANATTPNTNSTTPEGSLPSPAGTQQQSAPSLSKGSYVDVKAGTKWYATSYGGSPWGWASGGVIQYTNLSGSHPYSIGGKGWIRKEDIVGYDTGGYTGDWNSSDGKLGILHLKELVLNAADTENLLNAISRVVDLNAAVQSLGLSMVGITRYHQEEQTLQQEVTIHAEFPNVSDHNEIELAMENLVNRASQFANRRN